MRAKASFTVNSFCACAAGVTMLRTAQAFRLAGGIKRCLRAIGPGQSPQRGLEFRPVRVEVAGENAAFAFHHHRPCFRDGSGDEGDAGIGVILRHVAHPFGPGAGLAEAATGTDQPQPPAIGRRHLLAPSPQGPVVFQQVAFCRVQFVEEIIAFRVFRLGERFAALNFLHWLQLR
ncbi:hypothetical protein GCM10023208_02470 [Erythrobacter westpacificensis]|uniref:Uncharacterized protein n=1 Tax=Erythrobacter westpacificensis TaxID=1055231 RepID=A0ABP9JX86_9SPHN